MGRTPVGGGGVTVIPVVLALLFFFLLSALVLGIVIGGYVSGAQASIGESVEHSVEVKRWVKAYVYNVSLCKTLAVLTKAARGQPLSPRELDTSGPVRILVLNEGEEPVKLDHIAVIALGTIVHQGGLDATLKPGEYISYSPRDLSLPEDYGMLTKTLEEVVLHGVAYYNTTVFNPPPLAVVSVDEGGGCSEP